MGKIAAGSSAAFARKVVESSWGTILKPAAFTGRLCFGPSAGQRVRFTNPASWIASANGNDPLSPEAAAAEITRRFLSAYGPATAHDLARWWNGGGVSNARKWIAALGDEVTAIDLDGDPAWILSSDLRRLAETPPPRSVRLLPGFDQYVVAASWHAGRLLPGDLRARIYRPQGWISPVLLVNGFMHGVWRHELKGSRVEVVIEPFVKLAPWARRAAAEEAERLAAFLGGTLNLVWHTGKDRM
jgi:hypothetical protein